MKAVYPVIFKRIEDGWYMASIPDLNVDTQGANIAEAIEMARDAIGLCCIDMQDEGKELPNPADPKDIALRPDEIISMVDIDLSEYRRINDIRTVRRNVSLPSWLNAEVEKAGLNVSAVLQAALKQELRISVK
jgi:predicted RNase H-like HicB family nuclease